MCKEIILDEKEKTLEVGTRVKLWEFPASGSDTPPISHLGKITKITECESDVDDEGRPISIYPRVYVHWDGEDKPEDEKYGKDYYSTGFSTRFDKQEYGEPTVDGEPTAGDAIFICEELEAIE